MNVDNTENIISFCTGYGGIELGLKRVIRNLRTVCYVEIETFAQANLVAKIETGKMDAAPIWSDIKTFPAHRFRDKVHGIIAGYPCQPFSHAGKRQGEDDERHLWPHLREHIRTIRPLWVYLENVSGHLTLGFKEVLTSLRNMGYKVEAGLFTAAEVGFPHKRQRLFILSYASDSRYGELFQPQQQQGGGIKTDIRCNGEIQSLADTECEHRSCAEFKKQQRLGFNIDSIYRTRYGSPARPGQPQYKWEEPRTVKPGMGRTVNGFASRVDELRLLGNGVVPDCAELAFRTLLGKII